MVERLHWSKGMDEEQTARWAVVQWKVKVGADLVVVCA
jgi:hypothetical protein